MWLVLLHNKYAAIVLTILIMTKCNISSDVCRKSGKDMAMEGWPLTTASSHYVFGLFLRHRTRFEFCCRYAKGWQGGSIDHSSRHHENHDADAEDNKLHESTYA